MRVALGLKETATAAEVLTEMDMILGKDKLIVFRFDMDRILARIRKLFDNCGGKDWDEIAMKLSRIGKWEFENYQE